MSFGQLKAKTTVLFDDLQRPKLKSAHESRTKASLNSLKVQNEKLQAQVAHLQDELRLRPPRSALEEAKGKILSLERQISKRKPKQSKSAKLLTQLNAGSFEEAAAKAENLTREHQELKAWAKKMQTLMTKLVPGQKPSLVQVHKWVHKLTEEYLVAKRLNDQLQADQKCLRKLMKKFKVHSSSELWTVVCQHFT